LEIHTPKKGEYALIDKVVLGIMGNITTLRNKTISNPCLTQPPTDLTVPDMEDKSTVIRKPESIIENQDQDNELKRRLPHHV
jgi:hypothetical protein